MKKLATIPFFFLLLNAPVSAQTIDTAASYTHDSQFKRKDISTQYNQNFPLDEEDNLTLSLGATAGYADVELTSSDNSFIQVWDTLTRVDEQTGGLNLGMDFYKDFGLVAAGNRSVSQINASNSWSAGLYVWFLKETIQVSLNHGKNRSTQNSIDTIDRDAFRVVTPETLEGTVDSVSLLVLLTTTTIVDGSATKVTRTDRPDATAYSLGFKQYFESIEGALHGSFGYFENLGEIEPITLQGETTARSGEVKWLQRALDHYVVQMGYRAYFEHEVPRAKNAETNNRASDTVHLRLTYRDYDSVWTHPANEYYVFAGNYKNSDNLAATTWGAGIKLELSQ